jgi:hypothetical protein
MDNCKADAEGKLWQYRCSTTLRQRLPQSVGPAHLQVTVAEIISRVSHCPTDTGNRVGFNGTLIAQPTIRFARDALVNSKTRAGTAFVSSFEKKQPSKEQR